MGTDHRKRDVHRSPSAWLKLELAVHALSELVVHTGLLAVGAGRGRGEGGELLARDKGVSTVHRSMRVVQ